MKFLLILGVTVFTLGLFTCASLPLSDDLNGGVRAAGANGTTFGSIQAAAKNASDAMTSLASDFEQSLNHYRQAADDIFSNAFAQIT